MTDQQPDTRRRLIRPREDRMIAGVAAGLARHFDADPIVFRIAFGVLAFFGGLGLALYLAAVVFVPGETREGEVRSHTRNAAIVLGSAALLFVAVVGSAWGTAAGGGELVAALVIAVGAVLAISAFRGGAAWLVFPALALALPAGLVAAADVELEGGVGEQLQRPHALAALDDRYEHAVGRLELDLRDVDFPAGPTSLGAELGIGQLDVIVPEDVCVVSETDVGIGAIDSFGRDSGGIDVERREGSTPPRGVPQLTLDANVGIGHVRVVDDPRDLRHNRHDRRFFGEDDDGGGRQDDPCLPESS